MTIRVLFASYGVCQPWQLIAIIPDDCTGCDGKFINIIDISFFKKYNKNNIQVFNNDSHRYSHDRQYSIDIPPCLLNTDNTPRTKFTSAFKARLKKISFRWSGKIKKNVSPNNGQYFSTKQRKNVGGKKMRLPDWSQLQPAAGQETDLFFGDNLLEGIRG